MLDLVKVVVAIGGHLDQVPLLLETVEKVKDAKTAVQFVDATVPAQYAIANVVDDVRGSVTTAAVSDFDTEAAKVCTAFNAAAPAGEASAKKLLTIENLRRVAELIMLFGPIFLKR